MRFLLLGVLVFIMTTNSKVHASKILRIAFPTKQLQLDPQKIEDMYSMMVVNQLYAKLFRYTPNGQVRPDLVDRWSVSRDKRTYTFQLKKRTFSDGSPITAQHIANSLKRIFVLKAALSSDLAIISGAQAFAKSKNPSDLQILAQDSVTLKIETEKPTSLLIHLLAVPDVGVLKIADVTKEVTFDGTMAFSGPYKIKSMTSNMINLQKWRDSDLDSSNRHQRLNLTCLKRSILTTWPQEK